MQSKAKTVAEYLASLPADRREALQAVRQVILANLDADYEEGMQYGMIGYYVPHRVFPDGYHCDPKQPLPFAGLASQKGHLSLYLMTTYSPQGHAGGDWFRKAWLATGRKLDMGKACVRFQKADDVARDGPLPGLRLGGEVRRALRDAAVDAAAEGRQAGREEGCEEDRQDGRQEDREGGVLPQAGRPALTVALTKSLHGSSQDRRACAVGGP